MLFFRVYPNPHPRPLLSANLAARPLLCRPYAFRPFDFQLSTVNLLSLNLRAHRFPRPTRAVSSFSFPAPVPDSTLFSSTTCTLFFPTATPQPIYYQSLPHSFLPNGGYNPSDRHFYLATHLPRAGRGPLTTSVLTPLEATLTSHPTNVASKGLAENLTPLKATLRKNRGVPAMATKVPFRQSRSQAGRSQFTRSASRPATSPLTPDSLHPGSPSSEALPILGALRPHHRSAPTPKGGSTHPHPLKMLEWFQGATRFRRKLSRHEGMPGTTCPQRGGKLEMPTTTWHLQLN